MAKKNIWLAGLVIIIAAVAVIIALTHTSSTKPTVATTASASSSTAAKSQTSTTGNSIFKVSGLASGDSYLSDLQGNTLYTSGADSAGVSNCSGACLTEWPAYVDKGVTTGLPTNVGTLTRSDNRQVQYTYKGLPLYYFSGDSKGKTSGNGVGGFTVIRP